jgi:hypothetical protein
MAGTGRKTFTAGAVLAAADVQSYLQDQSVMVFDSSAARSSAIGTAVSEGMVSYLKDTDLVESYNGSAWSSIAPASTSGLNLVTPTSVAGTGVTFSGGAVSFSASTSVSVNGCFTSTYENYQIMVYLANASASAAIHLRFRASGADNSSANYARSKFYITNANASGSDSGSTGANEFILTDSIGSNSAALTLNVYQPQVAQKTMHQTISTTGTGNTQLNTGSMTVTTSYDGFTILPASGNVTGVLRVYGMRNS